jgi:hypothetical protein
MTQNDIKLWKKAIDAAISNTSSLSGQASLITRYINDATKYYIDAIVVDSSNT